MTDRQAEETTWYLFSVNAATPPAMTIDSGGLRVADALQLAAALVSSEVTPRGDGFVTLDDRLRTAARAEGFAVLPE